MGLTAIANYSRSEGKFVPFLHWAPRHGYLWEYECTVPCDFNLESRWI